MEQFKYEFKSSKDSEPPKPVRITNKEAAVFKAMNQEETLKVLEDLNKKEWFLGDDFGLNVNDLNKEE